jgi:hypothetical protein
MVRGSEISCESPLDDRQYCSQYYSDDSKRKVCWFHLPHTLLGLHLSTDLIQVMVHALVLTEDPSTASKQGRERGHS